MSIKKNVERIIIIFGASLNLKVTNEKCTNKKSNRILKYSIH